MLLRARDELEDKVRERTAELTRSNEQLRSEIAERERVSAALREREEFLRLLAENTEEFIRLFDPAGRPVYANPQAEHFLGRTPADFAGFAHPDDVERSRRWFDRILAGATGLLTWRVRDRNGEWRCMETNGTVVPYRGKPHVLTVCRDVTDRHRAAEALRESERRLKEAERVAHVGYWERDLVADRLTWSEETRCIFGLAERDALGQAELQAMIHPDDRELQSRALADAVAGNRSYDVEYRVVRPDGDVRFVHVRDEIVRDASGRPVRMFGTVQDLTERKRTEDEIRRQREILQRIFDNAPIGISFLTEDARYALVNREWERITGWTLKEVQALQQHNGEVCAEVIPDPKERQQAHDSIAAATGEWMDVQITARDVKTLVVSICFIALSDGTRIGLVQDITERKRAEEAVRDDQERLQSVLATLPVGVAVTDLADDIVLTNAAAERIWGRMIVSGRERLAESRGCWHESGQRIDPESWASVRAISTGQTSLNELIDIETFDGQKKTIQNSAAPIRNAQGSIVGAVFVNEDVTARKRAEDEIRESAERLRYLSRRLLGVQEEERRHIARELHDEFGQLLATTTLHLQAARGATGEAARPHLDECLSVLQQAGEEVRSLALQLRPTMLETAGLDATVRWLAEQHQRQTGIATQVEGHAGSVPGDLAIACFRVVQESLTNVVRHARARHVWIELSQSENRVELVVRDDGVGFNVQRTLGQAAARGSLGLLGMRERVELFGGTLTVDSASGRGTHLRAVFPLHVPTPVLAGIEE